MSHVDTRGRPLTGTPAGTSTKADRPLLDSAVSALAPMIWGSTYLVTTELLPADRPFLAAVVRALPAGLILLALGRVLPRGVWWWRALALGVLNIGGFFVLLFVAAYRLPGGVAAVVMSAQPMMVLVLAALLLGNRIRLVHVVACVLGMLGVALLVLKSTVRLDLVGVLAALGGALSMASGIVLTKRWPAPAGVGLLAFTGWQLTAGGLVLLPPMLAAEGLPSHLTGPNVIGFLYLMGFGSLFGYSVWFRGLGRLPAVTMSFLSFGSPIVAAALGYLFLGQVLTPPQVLGALAVVGAVALTQPRPVRPRDEAEPPPAVNRTHRGGVVCHEPR